MSRKRRIHQPVLLVFLLCTLGHDFCDFTKAVETETNTPQSIQRVGNSKQNQRVTLAAQPGVAAAADWQPYGNR
jgi:hypothetical protein